MDNSILIKDHRDELYKECASALQGGSLLSGKDFNSVRDAIQQAFETVDTKLLNWFRWCFIL